jgi:hypothetical protein
MNVDFYDVCSLLAHMIEARKEDLMEFMGQEAYITEPKKEVGAIIKALENASVTGHVAVSSPVWESLLEFVGGS